MLSLLICAIVLAGRGRGGGWKRLTERKGWGMSEIAGRLTWRLATFASFPTKDDDQEYSRMCAVLVVDGNKKRCRGIWL